MGKYGQHTNRNISINSIVKGNLYLQQGIKDLNA